MTQNSKISQSQMYIAANVTFDFIYAYYLYMVHTNY